MSVVITILVATGIFWYFGPQDFAINMSIFFGLFALLEGVNVILHKKTITQKFRVWARDPETPRWKVWLVTGTITAVGFFFTMHLAVGW